MDEIKLDLVIKEKVYNIEIFGKSIKLKPITLGALEKFGYFGKEDKPEKDNFLAMKDLLVSNGIPEDIYDQLTPEDIEKLISLVMPKKKPA